MTYAWSRTGTKAHILPNGAIGSGDMIALCGTEAHDPVSASEEDIQEAEGNLCRLCEKRRERIIHGFDDEYETGDVL